MTDGKPPVLDTARLVQPRIEEARLARMEADEAVHRIQQRIERLVSLSKPHEQSDGDVGREPGAGEREPDLPADKSD